MHKSDGVTPTFQRGLLLVVAGVAAALLAAYVPMHTANPLNLFAIAILIVASGFDAFSGSIPLLLLLFGVAASVLAAAADHRVPWLAIAAVPLGYSAWRTNEAAIGWGDVLALLVIAIALPFWTALAAVIIGTGCSITATLLRRQRAERMTPYLALGAVIALWLMR